MGCTHFNIGSGEIGRQGVVAWGDRRRSLAMELCLPFSLRAMAVGFACCISLCIPCPPHSKDIKHKAGWLAAFNVDTMD
jgi:hypothetical protein